MKQNQEVDMHLQFIRGYNWFGTQSDPDGIKEDIH